MTYNHIVVASWAVFILVWAIGSVNVKRDIKGGIAGAWSRFFIIRLLIAALLVFIATRVFTGTAHYSVGQAIFMRNLFTPAPALGWLGALLTALGVGFAIWARYHLGRNWSGVPSKKEGHELVTSGPYKYVRHPIYTGILLAALGAALAGSFIGLWVLFFGFSIFFFRIRKEERFMMELFPNEYPAYQARTKRLIPFVW